MTRRHRTEGATTPSTESSAVDAAGRTSKRTGTGLAGLAALACVACCALPALIAAGLIGGGAATALAAAMPQIAAALAIAAAATFGWAVYRSRRRTCRTDGQDAAGGGCADGCSCSTSPASVR
ncbi:hypothetical protein [Actinomadura sp. SCN-SB]|uniref:hypothetical protein n=1 Tax=Actinomadura sp. SCN-SB TaxID=3373092 RepID=UPI003750E70B